MMVGGVVSLTVTLNCAVQVFPAASVAVATTTVVPSGNVLPEEKLGPPARDGSGYRWH
jgi:hypothetical protein